MFSGTLCRALRGSRGNDLERVKALQHHVMAVAASLYTIGRYGSSAIKGIKCALSLMGICSDYLSYPYQRFLDAERTKVRAVLERRTGADPDLTSAMSWQE